MARKTTAAAAVRSAPTKSAAAMSCQRRPRSRSALQGQTYLAECESDENADGKKRHEPLSVAADGDQQGCARDAEDADAVTEYRPLAAQPESVWKQVVARQQAQQHREARRTRCWRRGSARSW